MFSKRYKKLTIILSVLLIVVIILSAILISIQVIKRNHIPNPELEDEPKYQKPVKKNVKDADYYVSIKTGSDDNNGSKDKPFKTITKAQNVIRELIRLNSNKVNKDITIAIMGGEYNFVNNLSFNNNDNLPNNHRITYTSYNNEEVIFSGGLSFTASDFNELSSEESSRLLPEIRKNVKVLNLFDKGVTSDTIGKLYAIGGFSQGRKYGEDNGIALQLYYNGKRMQLARYPNTNFTKIEKIVDYGEAQEHVPDIINWDNTPLPRPPKFLSDTKLKERMSFWKKPTNVLNSMWVYGYLYWDWADVSSPVNDFNPTTGQIDLKYSSPYGIKEGSNYYIYNVFEELDAPGEYYIDRVSGKLYCFFDNNYNQNTKISISVHNNIINSYQANNLTLDGFSLESSRDNAIEMNGNNIIISNMILKNAGGDGIRIQGFNNIISDNEIKNTGKNGIVVGYKLNYHEGNISNDIRKNGLKIENNLVKNNYIHNYGETNKTNISGISILGVGNIASHNEIFDAPSTGIYYAGNEHQIKYNYIHDVVKMSSDAGAIYAGRNLSFFGNVVRYNKICNIGINGYTPNGIYFDDCLAGQIAYGNLLANIKGNGFLIGGGREHKIYDNVIINTRDAIHYDARAYDGLSGGWYQKNVITPNARQWTLLKDAQALYQNWLKDGNSKKIMKQSMADYSKILKMLDFSHKEDKDSAATPNGLVENNIIISKNKHLGIISSIVKKYATIRNNKTYDLEDDNIKNCFKDYHNGKYKIKKESIIAIENKNYNNIPYHLIGRITK